MTELIDLFRSFINRQGLPLRTFLVGGAVRDLLLGIETKDADIALDGDSLATAEAFSREAGATFVLLDREWRTGRVVRGKEQIDISPLRGGSIEADLSERDLTINAMAIPLSKTTQGAIIDPFGGRRDLEDRLIRMVSEKNLRKDPLRVLRVYRFSATLSFSIEAETRAAAIRCSPLIASVARERIAEEMRHIFRTSPSAPTVQRLIEDRILHSVLPEMKDLGEASWLLYKEAEALLENPEELLGTLDKEIVRYKGDIQRLTCFRISLLPADRATAGMLCRGMKLSGRETTLIQKMVSLRERLTALYPYRERGIENPETIDFLQAAEEDLLGLTIFFSAFARLPGSAIKGDKADSFCRALLSFYHGAYMERKQLLPLITGDDLQRELQILPSPLFRTILSSIEKQVLLGKLKTRPEALKAAGEIAQKQEEI